jgi:50S ribosomal subunit-associated GTPase HflX
MIFEQTLTIYESLISVTTLAVLIFFWKFFFFRKKQLEILSMLPSTIIIGSRLSGKSSLTKAITESEIYSSLLEDGLGISRFIRGDKRMQIIDANLTLENIKKLKELNLKSMVYVFDVSSSLDSLKSQIKDFENFRKTFKNIKHFVVLNKIDTANKQTLKEIKKTFRDVYEVSAKTNEGLYELRESVISSLKV